MGDFVFVPKDAPHRFRNIGQNYGTMLLTLEPGGLEIFFEELQACFGYRLGALTLCAPRRAFPLSLIRAQNMVSGRTVIIGNAVHQLHPVAGQGFNLGIRDVVELAEILITEQSKQGDLGATELLNRYAKQRCRDHDITISFTDNVVRIFSNNWLPVTVARNAGLTLLDHLPSAKRVLTKHAMGFAGRKKG